MLPAPKEAAHSEFFIKFVSENSIPWVKTGKIPASKTVLESSEFKAISPEDKLAAELDYAHFPPALPGISDVLTQFWTGYQAAILGKAEPAAALKDSAAKANQILKANQSKYGG